MTGTGSTFSIHTTWMTISNFSPGRISKKLDFGYDGAGRLKTFTLPSGQIVYDYNATTGKLDSITGQNSSLAYTYKGALLSKTSWSGGVSGTVERDYDNDFRVKSLGINGNNLIAFEYDNDGLLKKTGDLTLTRDPQKGGLLTGTTLGNVTDSYVYNGFGEVTSYEAKHGNTSLLRFEYPFYDKLGRIKQKKEIRGGTTATFDYTYDDASGRLSEVKRNGAVTSSYGYDANGNRNAARRRGDCPLRQSGPAAGLSGRDLPIHR